MFFEKKSGGASWILVCLGNPGDKYENPRHNVGFMVADELAERQRAPIQKLKFKALTNVLTISGEKVLVMKPITYMNLSGEAERLALMKRSLASLKPTLPRTQETFVRVMRSLSEEARTK